MITAANGPGPSVQVGSDHLDQELGDKLRDDCGQIPPHLLVGDPNHLDPVLTGNPPVATTVNSTLLGQVVIAAIELERLAAGLVQQVEVAAAASAADQSDLRAQPGDASRCEPPAQATLLQLEVAAAQHDESSSYAGTAVEAAPACIAEPLR